ncbi:Fur family transcriptional regulator [Acidomonas methanolica]|uniref:Transcriptional regulator for ferric uptake n=1 Tax=Acidomonas methanolica NBRC 104435 TaxID=1231351 RepID=A0A023D685_ACIMT|nr:Fur family transcriptional regulator [Acidomonas methanolica]MBU2655041.1 transcriptional repressor [Acidomonas methanolica]TCS25644.1 Fur family ferric uptake transcriptional regulator [Acidomonas methanolica]GAJ29240.1 transcriptional regulator for ferric uptake [Acidomonas methanolica NBRC 104435]GBQ53242.1 Fur family transcriptional regulator [Acidomonas methanolica]
MVAVSRADEKQAGRPGGESRIGKLCLERGLKMTGQRRLIAQVLSEAEDHPDVEELYRRASQLDGRISIATVYRTVRLLEEKGILERRDFGGGRARYEASEPGHHYHLIDVDTGRVVEFEAPEHEALIRDLVERLGFELASHRLEVFGRRVTGTRAAEISASSGVSEDGTSERKTPPRPGQRRKGTQ